MHLTCPDDHDVVTPDLGWDLEETPAVVHRPAPDLFDWCRRCATHVKVPALPR